MASGMEMTTDDEMMKIPSLAIQASNAGFYECHLHLLDHGCLIEYCPFRAATA